jgi:serine/threonine protein kinase
MGEQTRTYSMATSCPDAPTLQSLLLGQLLDPDSARWEDHLEQCSTCVTTAATLAVHDALTTAARQAATGPPVLVIAPTELGIVQSLLKRTRSMCRASGADASTVLRPDALPFLDGPQQEGELGRLAQYRVLRLLGTGAMGVVFLAEDERLRRTVALKVLHPRLLQKPDARARFLREARAMAAISHEHIVSVYEVEERGVTPFLAMPVLKGMPLSAWLRQHQRPSLATIIRWGREIASGLAAAHDRGLIHRDVKPSNLWVEDDGGGAAIRVPSLPQTSPGRIKIVDFGLAYFDRDDVNLTASDVIIGTPAYMAPEQARGAAPDSRADLFSLGCVLYELCTGIPPFRGGSVMAVLSALANDVPAPVRLLNPAVPAALDILVMRLLAKEPARRPASAREVVAELAALERGSPVCTPRPWMKWLAAAALAATIVSVAGGIWWSRRRSNDPTPPQGTAELRPEPDKKLDQQPKAPVVITPAPSKVDRLVGHTGSIAGLVYPPGGRTLVSASADGSVRTWTLPAGTVTTLATHAGPVTAIVLADDGRILASATNDGSIRTDDVGTGQVLETLKKDPEAVWGLAFGRGHLLHLATDKGVVTRWLRSDHREWTGRYANDQAVRLITVSPQGDVVVAGTQKGWLFVSLLDLMGGHQIVGAHDGPVNGGVFAPDGELLATIAGLPDDSVRIWDMKVLKARDQFAASRIPQRHVGGVTAVAWSRDGGVIASAGADGAVRLWDPNTGKVHTELRHDPEMPGPVTCLAFSPDGRQLASGGADKIIRLHDVSAFSGPPKR